MWNSQQCYRWSGKRVWQAETVIPGRIHYSSIVFRCDCDRASWQTVGLSVLWSRFREALRLTKAGLSDRSRKQLRSLVRKSNCGEAQRLRETGPSSVSPRACQTSFPRSVSSVACQFAGPLIFYHEEAWASCRQRRWYIRNSVNTIYKRGHLQAMGFLFLVPSTTLFMNVGVTVPLNHNNY